jgi:hypothetical protein
MPTRMVDGDAWARSQKLQKVDERWRVHYLAWITLAAANGTFECNPLLIHKDLYAYQMPGVQVDDVVEMVKQFTAAGVIVLWKEDGKIWGTLPGIEKPGRLPSKAHVSRYKNLPPTYPGFSGTNPGTCPEGLVWFGKDWFGKDDSGTNPGEGPDMAIIRRISDSCLQILGVRVPYGLNQLGNPDGDALKQAARIYGEQEVQDAFESWADTQKGTTDPYLITKFVRIMDGLLRGVFDAGNSYVDLKPLGATLYEIGNQVFTNQQLAGLLKDYSKDELEAAYQEFVYSRDEYSIKFAVRDFCAGGADAVITTRRKREQDRTKQEKLATAQQNKLATEATKATSELDAKLKAEKESEQEALKELIN